MDLLESELSGYGEVRIQYWVLFTVSYFMITYFCPAIVYLVYCFKRLFGNGDGLVICRRKMALLMGSGG